MFIFDKINSIQQKIGSLKPTTSIGFVPTMGALHKGHLALIEQAKNENDIVVVSIFVNPTQFNNQNDLLNYPKPLENDLSLLKSMRCDIVFTPSTVEIYQKKVVSESFDFEGLQLVMEGKFRKGHFEGVGTVVKRLFEIIKPTRAYFGEKDYQQLQIIKKITNQFNFNIKIIPCPIFRELDGLAMSSRNSRLTKEQRLVVPFIYKTLSIVKDKFSAFNVEEINKWVENQFKKQPLLKLEYFQIADEETLQPITVKNPSIKYRAFIAVFVGEIRLIDNISL